MNNIKVPFRISLFGGSTDYKSFYEKHESFIIGTTIDKYCYLSMRWRPTILSKQYLLTYSIYELVNNIDEIKNPLIRESIKYFNITSPIELFSFSDIPSRTGLGGSSSYCIGLCYLINKLKQLNLNKKQIIHEAINIERNILNLFTFILINFAKNKANAAKSKYDCISTPSDQKWVSGDNELK